VIAADLTEMQVNANIDEADVGRIRPGQNVSFRVDAYPTDNFMGTVTQVRLQPVVVQNVTTYGAVITVPNRDLKLKPGMTANVKIEIAKRTNVLRVPNTALRFRPTEEIFAALQQTPPGQQANQQANGPTGQQANPQAGRPTQESASAPEQSGEQRRDAAPGRSGGGRGGGGFGGGGRGGPEMQGRMLERFKTMSPEEQQAFLSRMRERGGDTAAFEAAVAPASGRKADTKTASGAQAQTIDALFAPLPAVESRGRVWLYVDKQLKPVALRLGISDGTFTELLSGELQENTELVTGVTGLQTTTRQTPAATTGNPLMPGRGPGGRGPGGRGF
jgi:HlyD family secretion protein